MPLNRLVALLTPLFALAAGACATWLADNVPGVNVPADMLQEIFIAGAIAVLAPALHWLHGWQKWETRDAAAQIAADASDEAHAAPLSDAAPVIDDDWDDDLDDAGLDDEEDAAEAELAGEADEPEPAGVA